MSSTTAAQLGSRVSIKDVRLLRTPVAVDDAATLLEDGSLVINALTNDLSPDVPGFAPQIVAAAQHGQVNINTDGTFGYMPEANFYGADSFTYQYTNAAGEASSTVTVTVTVTLSITPVNDAPVAADVAVTTLEDTLTTINLIALDVDNARA